jgi:hypothetical protein
MNLFAFKRGEKRGKGSNEEEREVTRRKGK